MNIIVNGTPYGPTQVFGAMEALAKLTGLGISLEYFEDKTKWSCAHMGYKETSSGYNTAWGALCDCVDILHLKYQIDARLDNE